MGLGLKKCPPSDLIACSLCDRLHERIVLQDDEESHCQNCGHPLQINRRFGLQACAAYSLSALLFIVVIMTFSFMTLEVKGLKNSHSIVSALGVLWQQGADIVTIATFLFVFILPSILLLALFWASLGLYFRKLLPGLGLSMRVVGVVEQWAMMDVFLIAALVSLLKLTSLADVSLDLGFWALVFAVVSYAVAMGNFDPRDFWERYRNLLRETRASEEKEVAIVFQGRRGMPLGLASCMVCGEVSSSVGAPCRTCGSKKTKFRKERSIQHSLAFLICALITYIPANLMPIMNIEALGVNEPRTILSGVALFWRDGSYLVSGVIFTASVLIPMLKMLALIFHCMGARGWVAIPGHQVNHIYHAVEVIGKWSMVDVFVVAVLVSYVQLGKLSSIQPGPAVIAFGIMVIFNILAGKVYEPRLNWDRLQGYNDGKDFSNSLVEKTQAYEVS